MGSHSHSGLQQVLLLLSILAVLAVTLALNKDGFTEEMAVTTISSDYVLVSFHFQQSSVSSKHHSGFPLAVQQLADAVPFQRTSASLSHGRWAHHAWGAPPCNTKPAGAELVVTFPSSVAQRQLPRHWARLTHTLSGILCASFSLLSDPWHATPWQLHLADMADSSNSTGNLRLHASLPREAVCTENLTPWLKLLPCRDRAGLASLLQHRPTVFGAAYLSMAMDIWKGNDDAGAGRRVYLAQRLTIVLSTKSRDNGPCTTHTRSSSARAGASSHRQRSTKRSLLSLMNSSLQFGCPAASVSRIFMSMSPPPAHLLHVDEAGHPSRQQAATTLLPRGQAACCAKDATNLQQLPATLSMVDLVAAGINLTQVVGACNLQLGTPAEITGGSPELGTEAQQVHMQLAHDMQSAAPFMLERYITGSGLSQGSMRLLLKRPDAAASVAQASGGAVATHTRLADAVCIFQTVPWFFRVWLHTLQVQVDSKDIPLKQLLVAQNLQPAVDRGAPLVLDLCLHIPAGIQTLTLSMQFSKAFLTASEYPPDAQRGFDVPAAIVTVLRPPGTRPCVWRCGASHGAAVAAGENSSLEGDVTTSPLLDEICGSSVWQGYSDGLLAPMAVPDFSMPYNVLCLSSTVFAVFLGATLNSLLFVPRVAKPSPARQKLRRLVSRASLLVAVILGGAAIAVHVDDAVLGQAQQLWTDILK